MCGPSKKPHRVLRSMVSFTPPNTTPYYSARCMLKERFKRIKASDRCDVDCEKLRANKPLNYSCELGMMLKEPPKPREKEWN